MSSADLDAIATTPTAVQPTGHSIQQSLSSNGSYSVIIMAAGNVDANFTQPSSEPASGSASHDAEVVQEATTGSRRRWMAVPASVMGFAVTALLGIFVPGPSLPYLSQGAEVITAECRDGWLSASRHHSGTCSGHGGVAQWRFPPSHSIWRDRVAAAPAAAAANGAVA